MAQNACGDPDMPIFVSGCYTSCNYTSDKWVTGTETVSDNSYINSHDNNVDNIVNTYGVFRGNLERNLQNKMEEIVMATNRRIVEVYVVDPNKNIPIEDCILIKKDRFMTELTDQEIYFDINIKDALVEHNKKRITIVDKDKSEKFGKEVFLEAAKVRDLTMTVVQIIAF